MRKVAIIGVGQSAFVREYPGSIRELAFEGFQEGLTDAQITSGDIDASIICSAPEYDKQRSPAGVLAEYLGLPCVSNVVAIRVVDALPRTPSLKVSRPGVRALFEENTA